MKIRSPLLFLAATSLASSTYGVQQDATPSKAPPATATHPEVKKYGNCKAMRLAGWNRGVRKVGGTYRDEWDDAERESYWLNTAHDPRATDHACARNWTGVMSYGLGLAAVFSGSKPLVKTEEAEDGTLRVTEVPRRQIRPAFVASYLWAHNRMRFSIGPMVVTDLEIGEASGLVNVRRLGLGIMFGSRTGPHRGSGGAQERGATWRHDFGIGLAGSLDTDVQALNKDGKVVDVSSESLMVVLTYSFGRRSSS